VAEHCGQEAAEETVSGRYEPMPEEQGSVHEWPAKPMRQNRRRRAGFLILTLVTVMSVVLATGLPYAVPDMAWLTYLFKPLSTALLLVTAAVGSPSSPGLYRWSIVAGLVCSLAGDTFLMLPGDWFLPGLVSFLFAHLCYLAAFTSDCAVAPRRAPLVAWSVLGAALVSFLWGDVPSGLRAPVVLYTGFILAMAAQAAGRALVLKTPGALVACVGATLFVLSDSVLAVARFHGGFAFSGLLVLAPYFAGQWLIAVSVTFCVGSGSRGGEDVSVA